MRLAKDPEALAENWSTLVVQVGRAKGSPGL
jgi:hypothetical protein